MAPGDVRSKKKTAGAGSLGKIRTASDTRTGLYQGSRVPQNGQLRENECVPARSGEQWMCWTMTGVLPLGSSPRKSELTPQRLKSCVICREAASSQRRATG